MVETAKPVKLTPAMERILRFAVAIDRPVSKGMMENFGHRLGTYEALFARGLMHRPALYNSDYIVTAAGRAHPAVANA